LLDDAVAAFLDSVSERAFDEPLLALLRADGFSEVRLTHGQSEFGKDIIAKRDGAQWAFQSKAGNIGVGEWRLLTGQLDELRLSDYAGPEFDATLARRAVLVTTGRLVGNANLAASEYNKRARDRSEPEVELWNRDELISRLSGNTDAVLRGAIDGALLTTIGSVTDKTMTMASIEAFTRRWDAFPPGELSGRGVVEASLVCAHLEETTRLDLACHLALCLVRAAWANDDVDSDEKVTVANAAGGIFDVYAQNLWLRCDDEMVRKWGTISLSGASAWATYPVMCVRLAEILGLLVLRLHLQGDGTTADRISAWLASFVYSQPGVAHPIGDQFAVSLVPPLIVLGSFKPQAAQKLLTKTTVWLCDHYEKGADGLAPSNANASEEIDRAFGGTMDHVRLKGKRTISFTAAICLDLAAICHFRKPYEDIRNDQLAVGIVPAILRCPDGGDQYLATGEANRWELNPEYPDQLPRGGDLDIPHHRESATPRKLVREGRAWDLLAISSALRDRHFLDAIQWTFDATARRVESDQP
jgi:Restriction endonuclease